MNKNDQKFIEYWEKKRKGGFYKFSLYTGIIYAFFVILSAKLFSWNFSFTSRDLWISILAVLIGILLLGPFLWWNRERKFKKLTSPTKEKRRKK